MSMAIEAGDFKTGLTIMNDGDPWVVLDFQHVKPGKGAAILKTKLKNLKTGSTQEINFNASVKFEAANIERKQATYSYNDGETYYFYSPDGSESFEVNNVHIGDKSKYIVDNLDCVLMMFDGDVLDIQLPSTVAMTVVETTPAIKGAPSTQTKDATTDTGLTLRVPQFIEQGEVIMVNTDEGKYSGRA